MKAGAHASTSFGYPADFPTGRRPPALLSNDEIAKRLNEIRTLMELAGEPFFKFTAYERAASALENAAPAAELVASGELVKLPGIGKSIAATIAELCAQGRCGLLDELHARFPPTIFEVLGVSGIGIKTAAMLFDQFGIASLADLERAIETDAFAGVPRMGKKSIENIKRGILAYKGRQNRTPLARALRVANDALEYLRAGPPTHRLLAAGSLRRAEITVGDVDLVCTSDAAADVVAYFVQWPRAQAVLAEGPTKASIWLDGGLQIDLRVLPDHVYGNLLQHFTGSREHNIQLREYAVRKGLRVSENGILNLETGESIACRTEEEVYAAIGMQYIPPEMRSGIGEIELAIKCEIPELLKLSDVRGDFHMHSTWSDGRESLEGMIAAAAARGYEYHAITEHSGGRGGWGLAPERLRELRAAVEQLSATYRVRTLCSSEVDILPDGTMDYPDEVLEQLDIVVGSVHSAFNQTREVMTQRLIRACENPYVNIIGHPTGRNIEGFRGYEFDYDAVFSAAARTGTALEIDGQENRLDLPSALARRAAELGATFTVDSDAHSVKQLANLELAVSQARRAGLTKEQVLNTWTFDEVRMFVQRKRERP